MKFFVFVAVSILFVTIRATPLPEDSDSEPPSKNKSVGGVSEKQKQNSGDILGSIFGQGNKNGSGLFGGQRLASSGNSNLQKIREQYHRDVNAIYDFWIGRLNDRKEIWHSGNGATETNSNNGKQKTTN